IDVRCREAVNLAVGTVLKAKVKRVAGWQRKSLGEPPGRRIEDEEFAGLASTTDGPIEPAIRTGKQSIEDRDRAVETPFPDLLLGLVVPQEQRRLLHFRLRAAATVDAGADGDQPLCLQVSE